LPKRLMETGLAGMVIKSKIKYQKSKNNSARQYIKEGTYGLGETRTDGCYFGIISF